MADPREVEASTAPLTHLIKDEDEGRHGQISGTDRRFKRGEGVYYHDYLQLDKILSAQERKSEQAGRPAHDEMIFIVVHQAYELWFREILFELGSVISMFNKVVHDEELSASVLRLDRVRQIFQVLVQQMSLVETITPLDFLDFRDVLVPASGFQSVQFRLLEIRLGLRSSDRSSYQQAAFHSYFMPEHQDLLRKTEEQPTLFSTIEHWLERTPFLELEGWQWQKEYETAVKNMLDSDEQIIRSNSLFSDQQKEAQLKELESTRASFETIFDEKKHQELVAQNRRRLSHRAMQAALFIYLYRDVPAFQMPFRLLNGLTDLDELISTWRYRHMMMVTRVIGAKIGTGGSSGYGYLRTTIGEKYRVFSDLTNMATYLISRSALPPLPARLRRSLGFVWEPEQKSETEAAKHA